MATNLRHQSCTHTSVPRWSFCTFYSELQICITSPYKEFYIDAFLPKMYDTGGVISINGNVISDLKSSPNIKRKAIKIGTCHISYVCTAEKALYWKIGMGRLDNGLHTLVWT